MALKIATHTFFGGTAAGPVTVHKGASYDASDPIVAAFPSCFVTPDEWAGQNLAKTVSFGPGVEAATANPGEKRGTKPKQ